MIEGRKRILIVDDDADIREVMDMMFRNGGYDTLGAPGGRAAIDALEAGAAVDLIVSDMRMPGVDGKGLQDYLISSGRRIPIVFITAYGTIQDAVDAMKKGAVDFITKPFNKNVMLHVARRMLEPCPGEGRLTRRDGGDLLVYRSKAMSAAMETLRKVSQGRTPVLIIGKSGSGKGMLAKALHGFAPERPFVNVNCAAIPPSLIESELFGYRKGAFTGATANFAGKAMAADGGILFLDEIGDMPLELQPKLLRLLEEKTFDPLGSDRSVSIDARIVCATNRDLRAMVDEGRFRGDLYYRINTITVRVPDLRDRREDILPLVEYFLGKYADEGGLPRKALSEGARDAVLAYDWPGNVRELRNAIERAVLLSCGDVILAEDLLLETPSGVPATRADSPNLISKAERELIGEALAASGGNVTQAARSLGITRDTLRYKIKKYSLRIG
jgi:DNA-binding NtrC family response regulator